MKRNKKSKLLELIKNAYLGVIEDIDDPDCVGRVKCRVYGVYGDKNESLGKIPTEDLPWAYPYYDLVGSSKDGSGKFSTPKKGTVVRVIFEGDQYHPKYFSIEELDPELVKLLKNDYEGFHSILFSTDEKLKIYFAKKTGLLLNFDDSLINILPDNSILIQTKNKPSQIELKGGDIDIVTNNSVNVSSNNNVTINSNQVAVNGDTTSVGSNPIYKSVNGEQMMILLKILATGLDAKFPTTPGQFANIVQQMEQLILSATVTVSP